MAQDVPSAGGNHCPDPDCPYRKRHGRAAEYRAGFDRCSDCGKRLVAGRAPEVEPSPALQPAPWRRVGVSVVTLGLLWLASRIPLPGVLADQYLDAFGVLRYSSEADRFVVGALGIWPLVAGFVLVELAALLVPRWRHLREDGFEGRARLWNAAWVTATLLAAIQGWRFASSLESLGVVAAPGPFTRGILTVALALPSALLFPVGALLSRKGLGSGYSLLLAGAMIPAVLAQLWANLGLLRDGQVSGRSILLYLAVAALTTVLTTRFVRLPASAREIPLPASGIWPLVFAGSILGSEALLGIPGASLAPSLAGITPGLHTVNALLAGCSCVVLCWICNSPVRVAAVWRGDGRAAGADAVGQARIQFRRALIRTMLFVALVWTVNALAALFMERPLAGGTSLAVATFSVVALDLAAEWRFRREHGTTIAVHTLHRVYEVSPLLAAFRAAGIPLLLRGYHHRALLQFFGPFVPIELVVPEDRQQEALRLLSGEPGLRR